jgi:hypothetical protein
MCALDCIDLVMAEPLEDPSRCNRYTSHASPTARRRAGRDGGQQPMDVERLALDVFCRAESGP